MNDKNKSALRYGNIIMLYFSDDIELGLNTNTYMKDKLAD